ncbi:uncharacterized protein METZ01_LOCUS442512 [marine metagenome]|uniref:Uncharacterized protein n=1 Tax=marine metagenome TaxID=408172 RepID=A0A382Z4K1_9ZZZZ
MTKMDFEFQQWIQQTWMEHLDKKFHWKEKVDYTQEEWLNKNLEFLTNKFQETKEKANG